MPCWPDWRTLTAARDKKVNSAVEKNYQAAGSPLADEPMVHRSNPRRPADDPGRIDLLRALRRLPRRAAQGRHRQAADAGHHPAKGTDYLKVFIAYGSPAGMPNWLTSGEMTEKRST